MIAKPLQKSETENNPLQASLICFLPLTAMSMLTILFPESEISCGVKIIEISSCPRWACLKHKMMT